MRWALRQTRWRNWNKTPFLIPEGIEDNTQSLSVVQGAETKASQLPDYFDILEYHPKKSSFGALFFCDMCKLLVV